jgi:hypothetical protein
MELNIPYDTGVSRNNRSYDMENLYGQLKKLTEEHRLLVIDSNNSITERGGIPLDHVIGPIQKTNHDDSKVSLTLKVMKHRKELPNLHQGKLTIGGFGQVSEPDENRNQKSL